MNRFSVNIWDRACFDPITLVTAAAVGTAGYLASGLTSSHAPANSSAATAPAVTPVTPPSTPAPPAELAAATSDPTPSPTTPSATTPSATATLPTADATSLTSLAANRRAQANATNQAGRTSTILTSFTGANSGANRTGASAGTGDYTKRTLAAG